jgi:hypothetical protein
MADAAALADRADVGLQRLEAIASDRRQLDRRIGPSLVLLDNRRVGRPDRHRRAAARIRAFTSHFGLTSPC